MKRHTRAICVLLLLLLTSGIVAAGDSYLLDRELTFVIPNPAPVLLGIRQEPPDSLVYMLAEGRIHAYRWNTPCWETLTQLGSEISSATMAIMADTTQVIFGLEKNGLDYQIWHQTMEGWLMHRGSFTSRVFSITAGRFSTDGSGGLFTQSEDGRIGYAQLKSDGCMPIWQSPEPVSMMSLARSGDIDGDGLDELVTANQYGVIAIWRWHGGIWQQAWTLPAWGQLLSLDLEQTDAQPGLEMAIVTSERRVFLISFASGRFDIHSSMTVNMLATQISLLPMGNGLVILGDASGNFHQFVPVGATWRLETRLSGGEKPSFLAGLSVERVLAVSVGGTVRILHPVPLGNLLVYFDGTEIKNPGIYWEDGDFYFAQVFLRQIPGLVCNWDNAKSNLTMTYKKHTIIISASKTEVMIDGNPWPLKSPLLVLAKAPYVHADVLRAVLSINVTFDPVEFLLILTSASMAG